MKNKFKSNWGQTFGIFLVMTQLNAVQAEMNLGTGLQVPTEEQNAAVRRRHATIHNVRLNKLGMIRLRHAARHTHPLGRLRFPTPAITPEEEFETNRSLPRLAHATDLGSARPLEKMADVASALPSSVDNSKLPSFPPVGNQDQLGACVAWASTYYLGSHELGLLNGNNNQLPGSPGILSPKWAFNLVNGGNNYLYFYDPFYLLSTNGAPSYTRFPYDQNFTEWDLKAEDWIAALQNRIGNFQLLQNIDTPEGQIPVKQALVNGHVLVFGTFIASYVYGKVGVNPNSGADNQYAGQSAVIYMNGSNGSHAMTLVGYDDQVWVDINGNGQVDPGEMGAFLVANQWGTGFGNAGFIWIPYDSFLSTSRVHGAPQSDHHAVGSGTGNMALLATPISAHYRPKLVQTFTLNAQDRSQLNILTGISTVADSGPSTIALGTALTNSTYDAAFFMAYAKLLKNLQFNGVPYTDGSNNPAGSMALDLTDVIQSDPGLHRYYLQISNGNSAPAHVSSAALIDLTRGGVLHPLKEVPGPIGTNQTQNFFIDYDALSAPADMTPPSVSITSPLDQATVQGEVLVTVKATDQVGVTSVELLLDGNPVGSDNSAPYLFSVDTSHLSNGAHTLTAKATDAAGNQSQSTVTIQINHLSAYAVNCDGPAWSDEQGQAWSADAGFSGSSATYESGGPITGTMTPELYVKERYGQAFSYNFPVVNGKYAVTLKFAEIYYNSPGNRVFNVSVNGQTVLSQLDIFARVGGRTAYDFVVPVNVTGGNVSIQFTAIQDNAKISAIQITPLADQSTVVPSAPTLGARKVPITVLSMPNLCIEVAGAGTAPGSPILTANCTGSVNQEFTYHPDTHQITVYDDTSAMCLDADGSTGTTGFNGDPLQIWPCQGSPNQMWTYDATTHTILGTGGRYVDINGMQTTPGGKVQLWDYTGGWNQQWSVQ